MNDTSHDLTLELRYRNLVAGLTVEYPGAAARDAERRAYPRFPADRIVLQIPELQDCATADLSASGISLLANVPLEPGTRLIARPQGGRETVSQAEVLSCTREPAPVDSVVEQYRIHCRFTTLTDGMALFVDLHESETEADSQWLDQVVAAAD